MVVEKGCGGALAAIFEAELQSVVEDRRAGEAGGEEGVEAFAHAVNEHHLIAAMQRHALVETHDARDARLAQEGDLGEVLPRRATNLGNGLRELVIRRAFSKRLIR